MLGYTSSLKLRCQTHKIDCCHYSVFTIPALQGNKPGLGRHFRSSNEWKLCLLSIASQRRARCFSATTSTTSSSTTLARMAPPAPNPTPSYAVMQNAFQPPVMHQSPAAVIGNNRPTTTLIIPKNRLLKGTMAGSVGHDHALKLIENIPFPNTQLRHNAADILLQQLRKEKADIQEYAKNRIAQAMIQQAQAVGLQNINGSNKIQTVDEIIQSCKDNNVSGVFEIIELEDDDRNRILLQMEMAKLQRVANFANNYPAVEFKFDIVT